MDENGCRTTSGFDTLLFLEITISGLDEIRKIGYAVFLILTEKLFENICHFSFLFRYLSNYTIIKA